MSLIRPETNKPHKKLYSGQCSLSSHTILNKMSHFPQKTLSGHRSCVVRVSPHHEHSIKTLSWPSGVFFSYLFYQKMNTIGAKNYHCLAYRLTMNKDSVPVKMEGPPPGS